MKILGIVLSVLFITSVGQTRNTDGDHTIPFNQWASDLAIICSNYDFSQYGDYSLSFTEGNEYVFYVTTPPDYRSKDWKARILGVFHTDGDHCAGYSPAEAMSFIEGFPQNLPIGLSFPHSNRELFNCREQMLDLKARGYSIARPTSQLIKGKQLTTHVYKYPIIDIYGKTMNYRLYSYSKVSPEKNLKHQLEHGLCQIK